MLVTERMIDRISYIRQQSLKVGMKKKLVDAAKREVLDIEIDIEGIEARIEYLKDDDPAEQKEAQVELEQLRSKLPEAEFRRDMLRDDMEDTLETFELVFGAADLLDPLEPQDEGSNLWRMRLRNNTNYIVNSSDERRRTPRPLRLLPTRYPDKQPATSCKEAILLSQGHKLSLTIETGITIAS